MTAADELLRRLTERARGRRRVRLDDLLAAFALVAPELHGRPTARGDLARLLAELAEAGAVELPRTRWDRTRSPPLPLYVVLPPRRRERVDPTAIPWAPELAFVASLRVRDLTDFLALQAFFARGGRERPVVPLRERSLDIFGDEKRLERLRKRSWFEKLGLEVLGAEDVPPPLVWEPGQPGRPLLVIENHHTWTSFVRWNARTGAYGGLAYGAGNALYRTGRDLPRLLARAGTDRVEYFGDLDPDGLVIPAGAAERVGVTLEPAVRWYRALLDEGVERPLGRPVPDGVPYAWLGPLEAEGRALIEGGSRMAQEAIGTEYLQDV